MALKFYNTLTREKEIFVPINPPKVGFYSCGPTVYNYAHIGNLRSFIMADLLYRTLKYDGYKPRWVMNITDIDDKIIKKATELGVSIKEITDKYTEAYHADMAHLGIQRPDIEPKATESLDAMFLMIQNLLNHV